MAYTAVIVEPRKHKALYFVINNALTNLSDEWNILIFHGIDNTQYVTDICASLSAYTNRIQTINLNIQNLTISEYSTLLTTKDFYTQIPTDLFLIFQTDSMIFSKNKHLINNFLHYDYVGAPWSYILHNNAQIGNGGFSLRKKSVILNIIDTVEYKGEPEDVYFSCSGKLNVPTVDEAKTFSIEQIYSPVSFGCHQPWKHTILYKENLEVRELCILNDKHIELEPAPAPAPAPARLKILLRKSVLRKLTPIKSTPIHSIPKKNVPTTASTPRIITLSFLKNRKK